MARIRPGRRIVSRQPNRPNVKQGGTPQATPAVLAAEAPVS